MEPDVGVLYGVASQRPLSIPEAPRQFRPEGRRAGGRIVVDIQVEREVVAFLQVDRLPELEAQEEVPVRVGRPQTLQVQPVRIPDLLVPDRRLLPIPPVPVDVDARRLRRVPVHGPRLRRRRIGR